MGGESYVQAAKDPAPWGGCGVLLSLSLLDLAAGVEDKSGLGVSIRPNVLQFEAAERAGNLEVSGCHLLQTGTADGAAHRQLIGFHAFELQRTRSSTHFYFLRPCVPQDDLTRRAGQFQLSRLDIGYLRLACGSSGRESAVQKCLYPPHR